MLKTGFHIHTWYEVQRVVDVVEVVESKKGPPNSRGLNNTKYPLGCRNLTFHIK
jgi:hypothetical protein